MRRVVHLRLKASAAYGCFEIQRKKGLHPEHKRLSTVVAEVVESVVHSMKEKGELENISDEDADRRLREWLAGVRGPSEQSIGVGLGDLGFDPSRTEENEDEHELEDHFSGLVSEEPDSSGLSKIKKEGHVDPEEQEQLPPQVDPEDEEPLLSQEELELRGREVVGAAQRFLESESQEIFKEGEEEDEGEPVPLADRPPWEEEGVLTLDEIGSEAGKDHIYDRVMSNPEASEADQRALQVVYSKIPRELWGTDRAEELISQLRPVVEQHLASRKAQDDKG